MRRIILFLTDFLIAVFLCFSCEKESTESSADIPEVTTTEVNAITDTSAQCGGEIISDGGAAVTARGVCWGTCHNPIVADDTTNDGIGVGSFTSNITGLTAETTYYVCAYATNSEGTGYGSVKSFTTVPVAVPVLTTAEVSAITQTTAQCGGTIASDGGATVTARGVCWSTDQNPTVADDTTNDGTGVGSFTSNITGLTAETTYYVRAYATNSAGTGYGSDVSFTTKERQTGTVTDIDGNVCKTVKIGNQWWMAENLKVTHYRNGDAIPNITNNTEWENLTTGAYCNYDNNVNNANTYGRMYNWYAVNDSRNIAPEGWHVPSDEEWRTLIDYLGGYGVAGGKMKETGTQHWASPNTGATNESGFSALSGGFRSIVGTYWIRTDAFFWSSTDYGSNVAWSWYLSYICSDVRRFGEDKRGGFSVRLVMD